MIGILVCEHLFTPLGTILPLGDERTQHLYAMLVTGVRPAWRWNGHKVMAEVHEYVNVLPMIEAVAFRRWKSLNKSGTKSVEIMSMVILNRTKSI